jgi:hypothetical protein
VDIVALSSDHVCHDCNLRIRYAVIDDCAGGEQAITCGRGKSMGVNRKRMVLSCGLENAAGWMNAGGLDCLVRRRGGGGEEEIY